MNLPNLKIIIVLFSMLTVVSCFSDTKIYEKKDIGFSLAYPKDLIFADEDFRIKNMYMVKNIKGKDTYILIPIDENKLLENKYTIWVNYEKVSESEGLAWMGLNDKALILKKLKNKEDKIFFRKINKTRQFFIYDNTIIGEEMMSDIAEYVFSFSINIVKGEYIINIGVNYYDPFRSIQKKYPNLFKVGGNEMTVWKDDRIYEWIMNGDPKAPVELVKLYQYFKEIEESIKLY